MPFHIDLALDNDVKPGENSEIITHLGFYSGWANAHSAVAVAKDIFARLGIGPEQLSKTSPQLLPLDQATEALRAVLVQENVGRC
jgi:4-carboxymuconolactone decarboxylase